MNAQCMLYTRHDMTTPYKLVEASKVALSITPRLTVNVTVHPYLDTRFRTEFLWSKAGINFEYQEPDKSGRYVNIPLTKGLTTES